MGQETKPYMGQVSLIKMGTASGSGGGPMTNLQQRNIFNTLVTPMNPANFAYPVGTNASSYPSVAVAGMKTPIVHIQACYKPYNGTVGWADADLFNSLINVYTDSSPTLQWNSDYFLIRIRDNRSTGGFGAGDRIWEWARCESLTFSQDALGGPIMVSMAFKSRYGESQQPADAATNSVSGEVWPNLPTITVPSTDAGLLTNCSQTDFLNSGAAQTLTQVRRWSATYFRGQTFERYFDGTLNPAEISSKMFSGLLEIHQNPNTGTYISSGTGLVSLRLATDKIGSSAGAIRIDHKVNTDNAFLPMDVSAGNGVFTYSCIDLTSGGNPATFNAI
jgi:hypothetical protein